MWLNMRELGVDVLITAPQKGWTSTPCAGIVMLSDRAVDAIADTQSTSFACDLKQWRGIMQRYEEGGHGYYATMPTDGLRVFRDVMHEAAELGFDALNAKQIELGQQIRAVCAKRWQSLVVPEFASPSVVVCYANNDDEHKGRAFAQLGMQIAGGVPLQCNEAQPFKTFRIGLFGFDKLMNIDETVSTFTDVVSRL